ncbi:MAG: ABC transporter ATP-binding protein [Gammaproteobacteria bacterium]|nr:MAG: ABC transporter ATP-binding protein [Gammaproteobacteria bacterium]
MTRILSVENLSKRFMDGNQERLVLDDVSFVVESGTALAVCGPSGCGKSTLLNLIAGILEPDAGRIVLNSGSDEIDYTSLTRIEKTQVRRKHLGYVFQFFNLVPTLTVRENVLLPLELNGSEHLERASLDRLAALGLADREDDFPESLSGGERQRTAIARALAHEPVLVLADEPTGNLDAGNAQTVAQLLWREVLALGGGLVIATHNESIASMANHVLRLNC